MLDIPSPEQGEKQSTELPERGSSAQPGDTGCPCSCGAVPCSPGEGLAVGQPSPGGAAQLVPHRPRQALRRPGDTASPGPGCRSGSAAPARSQTRPPALLGAGPAPWGGPAGGWPWGLCVCRWQGDTDPPCHRRDRSGSRRDGAARVPSAITNSSCSGHVFAFACLIFSTPFATFPAPSLHFSLLFPILPLFFCFFSFCSSCLLRAAARGDGVVGSSGRWAACRGAFGSSPGSRQARGVRAGTRNHAPGAGAGAGGSGATLGLVAARGAGISPAPPPRGHTSRGPALAAARAACPCGATGRSRLADEAGAASQGLLGSLGAAMGN